MESLFIIDNFASDTFQKLHKARCKIIGPPVVISCAHTTEVLSALCSLLFTFHSSVDLITKINLKIGLVQILFYLINIQF